MNEISSHKDSHNSLVNMSVKLKARVNNYAKIIYFIYDSYRQTSFKIKLGLFGMLPMHIKLHFL
jgi:hypothetical protein